MEFNGNTMTAFAQFTSGEGVPEVVFVQYGKTPFAEMEEAIKAGKLLVCINGAIYAMIYDWHEGKDMSFRRFTTVDCLNYFCTKTGGWNTKTTPLQDARHTELENQIQALEERIAALESASGDAVFYLNGEAYDFEQGMTWEQFVNSSYNPTYYVEDCCNEERSHFSHGWNSEDDVTFSTSCCGPADGALVCDNGIVSRYDEIIAGCEYWTANDF